MRIHPEAEHEARSARRWYKARAGPVVAERFERGVVELLDRIEEGPYQFLPKHGLIAVDTPPRPLFLEVRRAMLLGSYTREREPHLLAFAHGKRRPGYWNQRRF